jgi:iron complex outermembrane recepter protein
LRTIVIIVVLFSATVLRAQVCDLVLRGIVRDEDNSEQLSFAVVKHLGSGRAIQCNDKGEFLLTGLCKGEHQILISHVGCKDTVFRVDVQRSRKVIFRLPHALNALKDVEVVSKHTDAAPMQAGSTLDARQLDRVRGTSLAEQLKQVNGVTSLNTGPTIAKPVLNGMQGYRLLILNNGIRHEAQQWGNEHAPEIDPYVAGRLTVLRGAGAVRYGSDAIGGVVLVEPAAMPDSAGIGGEFNVNGQSNGRGGSGSLMLHGRPSAVKYLSWRAQGSGRRTGNLRTPDYFLKNTGLKEYNYSAALDYHRRELGLSLYYSEFNSMIGIFSGAHSGSLSDLYTAFARSKPLDSLAAFSYDIGRPYQEVNHRLGKINLDFHAGPRTRLYAVYAVQQNNRREFDKDVAKSAHLRSLNLSDARFIITTQTADLVWEHEYIRSFRGKYGVQGIYQDNDWSGRFFIPSFLNRSAGIFALERFVRPKLELEAGLRYDYKMLESFYFIDRVLQTPVRTFSNFSYNLGAAYKLSSVIRATLNFANGWRAPASNELYSDGLHHGIGAIERGDPSLKTEYCNSAIAAITGTSGKLSYSASFYHYIFKDFIYYQPAPKPELTIRGAFPVFNYLQSDAVLSGADGQLEWRLTELFALKGRVMWLQGTNTESGQPLIYLPPARYELSFVLRGRNGKRFTDIYIEPAFMYVSKQTRVPAGVDFAPPPEGYFLVGLNTSATVKMGGQDLIFTFSITNAANTRYRDYLDRFRYYADALGSNYILRLRIPFYLSTKHVNR